MDFGNSSPSCDGAPGSDVESFISFSAPEMIMLDPVWAALSAELFTAGVDSATGS